MLIILLDLHSINFVGHIDTRYNNMSGSAWHNADWAELHLDSFFPLHARLHTHLVDALPPLAEGSKVVQVCMSQPLAALGLVESKKEMDQAGIAAAPFLAHAALEIHSAYPSSSVHLLLPASSSSTPHSQPPARIHRKWRQRCLTQPTIHTCSMDDELRRLRSSGSVAPLAGCEHPGCNLLVDVLNLQQVVTAEHMQQMTSKAALRSNDMSDASNNGYGAAPTSPSDSDVTASPTLSSTHSSDVLASYRSWLGLYHRSLSPGGMLVLGLYEPPALSSNASPSASTAAHPSLFSLLTLLDSIGFVEVDVLWREGKWALVGARKEDGTKNDVGAAATATSTATATATQVAHQIRRSEVGHGHNAPHTSLSAATSIPRPLASPASRTSIRAGASPPSSSSYMAIPSSPLSPTPTHAAKASSSFAASSSYANPASDPTLVAKLPQLFSRFDPYNTGQLTYKALCALCEAVGRPANDDDDDDDSSNQNGDGDDDEADEGLWWTYQSVAQQDEQTGSMGISIEDLHLHFYKSGLWNLRDDLHKVGLL